MGKKPKRVDGVCTYCGAAGGVTDDHVIPRTLFDGPMPSHPRPPKVTACPRCNNNVKSEDDVLVRDLLATDIYAQIHPAARAVFDNKTRAAARKNASVVARAARDAKLAPFYSRGGVYLGEAYQFELPAKDVNRAISNMVRGLCSHYAGRRLPAETEFEVNRFNYIEDLTNVFGALAPAGPPQYRVIGDGQIFECMYWVGRGDLAASFWILRFYRTVMFTIATTALEAGSDDSAPAATA